MTRPCKFLCPSSLCKFYAGVSASSLGPLASNRGRAAHVTQVSNLKNMDLTWPVCDAHPVRKAQSGMLNGVCGRTASTLRRTNARIRNRVKKTTACGASPKAQTLVAGCLHDCPRLEGHGGARASYTAGRAHQAARRRRPCRSLRPPSASAFSRWLRFLIHGAEIKGIPLRINLQGWRSSNEIMSNLSVTSP